MLAILDPGPSIFTMYSCFSKWGCYSPLLFFLPLSPCLRSSVAAVRNRRRRTSPEPFPATSWSISPPLVFPENGASIAPSRASPRAGFRRARARRRRRSPRHRAGRGMPTPGQPSVSILADVAATVAVAHLPVRLSLAGKDPGPVKRVPTFFWDLFLKTENEIKLAKFISIQILIRKMQLIYQNAQQGNIYLLVTLVELFDQNKLLLINKYRNGRI